GKGVNGSIYLAIIWHQHQPLYFKDSDRGVYNKPWVRLHAVKDYLDMAAFYRKYPGLKATFNLTPSLLKQIVDLNSGTVDYYYLLSEKPVDDLTKDEKIFIIKNFFQANYINMIKVHPRYDELFKKRGEISESNTEEILGRFSNQDILDLQVWFNLSWIDPDIRNGEEYLNLESMEIDPSFLKRMVKKGGNFTQREKEQLLDIHRKILAKVVDVHKNLQNAGQIEITTTPFYHPILPLIYDTDLARVAMPGVKLPENRFSFPEDVKNQLTMGIEFYRELFGRSPKGLWPSEGSVAQPIIDIITSSGFLWMASDEEVLAASFGKKIKRRGDRVLDPDFLYRPYRVAGSDGKSMYMVFRDHNLSDKIGFKYSQLPGDEAAQDLISQIHRIRENLNGFKGPHLVTLILDGENAWEYYASDGKDFFNAMYSALEEDPLIKTVTVSEFLERFGAERSIPSLWAGSWISHDFHVWIGEEEENMAWDMLFAARKAVQDYSTKYGEDKNFRSALEEIYSAEGSDWFWWYGDDQDSGDDPGFDETFRSTLKKVYAHLGIKSPNVLNNPIVTSRSVPASKEEARVINPAIDGILESEWDGGGYYDDRDGSVSINLESDPVKKVHFGKGEAKIYMGLEMGSDVRVNDEIHIFFEGKEVGPRKLFEVGGDLPRGFNPSRELRFSNRANFWETALFELDSSGSLYSSPFKGKYGWTDGFLEIEIPLNELEYKPFDRLRFVTLYRRGGDVLDLAPDEPGSIFIRDGGLYKKLVELSDPAGDDFGPGEYLYPSNPIFRRGDFDLVSFNVYEGKDELIFEIGLKNPIRNVWGSPINLSLQTIDVYIDAKDGGISQLLPGRNACVAGRRGWDYALWIEGWRQLIFSTAGGEPFELGEVGTRVIQEKGLIFVRLPEGLIPGDPGKWGFIVLVLAQDGFTPPDNWRVRVVEENPTEMNFGGGGKGTYKPNIIDVLMLSVDEQKEVLGTYTENRKVKIPLLMGTE
ncbi:MAG: glucodextranase DOMON-like domain-containing protein, partial [Fidelibacterota bacterium]